MWKEITASAIDIKKKPDTVYEGVYLGSKTIQTKLGEQIIYKFEGTEGEVFAIYGFTNLNRAMDSVSVNSHLRITYLGTKNVETKFGMKDVHQVRVEKKTSDDAEEDVEAF